MEPWYFPLLAVAGIAVGFLNVMAGGGSLISLPILIFLGLEPAVANGTNRVAILIQNITAVSSFRSQGYSEMRRSLGLALCTVPGAIAGAFAAVVVDPVVFKRILGVVLVAAVILILRKSPSPAGDDGGVSHPILAHLAMVGVGFWGGFLQAGVGFLIMPILYQLLRLDLIRVNMHKVFIVGIYTIPALFVFALEGKVWWLGGLALAVGNAFGAWLATRVTVTHGERAIRVVFTAAVIAMGVKLILG
ncbi:MAG: sulfite exporter TauE/SafE family protein [Thermoanaerobaculales bacterium]|nr:sulfite exporter TauE/SafE family protein [Thermoanaerobaculales bacterium]